MKIKFCGIRRKEDIEFCNILLPDFMGMILSKGFRRTVSIESASELIKDKNPYIKAVGVFVNESAEYIVEVAKKISLNVIQLHGDETAETVHQIKKLTGLPVWKAIRVKNIDDILNGEKLNADQLVLEGYSKGKIGGEGVKANWELLSKYKSKIPFFLAGGLTPENLPTALNILKPDGVDFSSGIETDNVKDFNKMQSIINIIRGE